MAEFRRRRAKLRVKAEEIDYKNVELLKRFVSDKGKINPSRLTGANAKLQRKIAKAVKRADVKAHGSTVEGHWKLLNLSAGERI